MSQSDYIQFKNLKNTLLFSNQKKLDPILDSQDYTLFVKYAIESTIPNTKLLYNQLIPPNILPHPPMDITGNTNIPNVCKNVCNNVQSSILGIGKQTIFNIEQPMKGCPTFIDCVNTNVRPNRVLTKFATATRVPVTPVPKYIKVKPSKKCTISSKYKRRICICTNKICKCGTTICQS